LSERPIIRHAWWLLLPLLLSACATGPTFDSSRVNRGLTPKNAVAKLPAGAGNSVLWGGVILSTTNLRERTDIEVLGYPLDGNEKPQRDREPLGRFIVQTKGFLEPATYGKDRLLSVIGTVSRTQAGKVGASDYVYPVIDAGQLYLWPRETEAARSGVRFGIGVGFGF
jgi:outer membrane lipoprotein